MTIQITEQQLAHQAHATTLWINRLFDVIEAEDTEARIDISCGERELIIVADTNTIFHLEVATDYASCELRSPISGVTVFTPHPSGNDWVSRSKVTLTVMLAMELNHHTGGEFTLNIA
jgi:frataxin-like iron-binding protein CyaY